MSAAETRVEQQTRNSELRDLPVALTVEEAAEVLRIGKNAAYAAVSDGSLPSIRIGRLIRIPRHALVQLLESAGPREPAAPRPLSPGGQ